MTTLKNNIDNQLSQNPKDILIYEKGLRIKTILPIKELDIMIIVLNNAMVLKSKISCFFLLKDATQEQLNKWEIRNKGVAIRWDELDEDLSLYGFLNDKIVNSLNINYQNSDLELVEVY